MDALDRLYHRLLDAYCREHGDALDHPITIAEIYQTLIPYRLVRGELGFGELAEYEHTLLRLLAGERDYLQIDLPQAREELRREIRSPNPILGVYRDYAAVDARLSPAGGSAPAGSAASPPPAVPVAAALPVPAPLAAPLESAPSHPAVLPVSATAVPAPASAGPARPSACRQCHHALPRDCDVRFCPFCGAGQQPVPCRECGTPVEPEWSFCIACGTARRAPELRSV